MNPILWSLGNREFRHMILSQQRRVRPDISLRDLVAKWWADELEPALAKHEAEYLAAREKCDLDVSDGWLDREKRVTDEWAEQQESLV